jgi:hypothetical protein
MISAAPDTEREKFVSPVSIIISSKPCSFGINDLSVIVSGGISKTLWVNRSGGALRHINLVGINSSGLSIS